MSAASHRKSSVRKKLTLEAYRVGWISALPLEFTAAQAILDDIHEDLPTDQNDANKYVLGSSGSHNIVMACLPLGMYGTNSAATVATNMNRSFPRLHIRLLVGIGGGVPGKIDIRLGDVVVSTGILQYDLGKTVENGRFQPTGECIKPPPHLLTATSKTGAKPEQTSRNTFSLVSQMVGSSPDMAKHAHPHRKDRLFDGSYDHQGSSKNCKECDRSKVVKRPKRADTYPKIHYGQIASANQVMKHGKTRDELAEQHNISCFEMEAAGIMHSFPSLVIRGICDYSDSHKNKAWQNYAAATAAAYAKELLSLIPTPQDGSDPIDVDWRGKEPVSLQGDVSSFMDSLEFNEIDSRQETIDEAHESTCKWLLDHQGYKDWLSLENATEDRGLWINGKPGAGKSTLIKYAFANAKNNAGPGTTVTSFFFNARGVDLEKSTTGVYRSLLFQLLKERPELQGLLPEKRQGPLGKRPHSPWSLKELRDLFETAVGNLGHRRLICFIDALDESDEDDVRDMISDFSRLGKHKDSMFSVCFSSRHYPFADISFGLKLALDDHQGHINDLHKYVQGKLETGSEERAEIKREILRKAEGIFMWVVLVVKILNKEYRRGRIFAVHKRLQELPSKLSDLFKDIMTRDKDNMEDLLLCIRWLLYAKRPLTVPEFYFALAAELAQEPKSLGEWDRDRTSEDDMRRYVTSSSKGLALVTRSKPETVQFIHESVRDFLIAHGGVKEVWPKNAENFEPFSHDYLKKCCYNYLTVNTFKDKSGKRVKVSRQKPGRRFPFLQYANHYILHHANAAAHSIPQDCFLKKFSSNNYENWAMIRNFFGRIEDSLPPLLYVLAEYNLTALVRTHLRMDPRFNCKGGRYRYPIFVALANDNPEVVEALFHDINSLGSHEVSNQSSHVRVDWDQEEWTPLIWAIKEGNVSRSKRLIESKEFDVNSWEENYGQTPVSTAAKYGRVDIMKLLLGQEGANPGLKDGFQRTPLSRAAENNHLAVTEILLATGRAKENSKDRKGRTALLWAVKNGHVDTVRLLLASVGVNANARDRRGETPLLWAMRRGNLEIVKLLISVKGVDIDARDKKNCTALSVATREGNSRIVEILQAVSSLKPDPGERSVRLPSLEFCIRESQSCRSFSPRKSRPAAERRQCRYAAPLVWARKK